MEDGGIVMRHYYRNKAKSNRYLVTQKPISEEALSEYDEITEQEYCSATGSKTEEECRVLADAERRIPKLKESLQKTDYIACKLAECDTDEERQAIKAEYATQLSARAETRAEINRLEAVLAERRNARPNRL